MKRQSSSTIKSTLGDTSVPAEQRNPPAGGVNGVHGAVGLRVSLRSLVNTGMDAVLPPCTPLLRIDEVGQLTSWSVASLQAWIAGRPTSFPLMVGDIT